jgi:glycolate oxidase
LSVKYGLRVANVFHAGDGNLHPLILFDGRKEGALERAETMAGEILSMCIELGGSITGEHGVGVEKLDHMPEMFGELDLQVMSDIRRAIDPGELANRGKKLAVASATPAGAPAPHPLGH